MKNNDIRTLLGVILLVGAAIVVGRVYSQTNDEPPPPPAIPNAHAEICGNVVVATVALSSVLDTFRSQGCTRLRTEYIRDDYWLVFGTKIIVKE